MRNISRIACILLLTISCMPVQGQAPLQYRDSSLKGSQTFAMIIGISKYRYVRALKYADKDAELFRDFLKSPGGGSVKDQNIFALLNTKANNANFWGKGFQWLKAKKLQRGDRLFIYLAGHGDAIDQDQFFFLGYDCNPAGDKNNYLVGGAIQLFNLKKKIANETAKGVEVVFIMDACRSNELPGGTVGQNFLNSAISEKKAGEIIMLAAGAGEESCEDASIGSGHGLFTYYLVDGLTGVADDINDPDRKISFREIQDYVDKNVPSVAQLRFNRKQDPYFCCNEYGERIISSVDTTYLSKWLKSKKNEKRGPGNSFTGVYEPPHPTVQEPLADTLLLNTYNQFNKAIDNKNLTGPGSAEDYYRQLEKKFPENAYTLDAKSTLAVEFINYAQDKTNEYLDCLSPTAREKQECFEAGSRLEKAISILGPDEPDFTNTLQGKMYFLKASGDFGSNGVNGTNRSTAFQFAFAAFKIDRNAAYINNRLATLHLDENHPDSALYYAKKAIDAAPKWKCAYATLGLAYRALNMPDSANKYRQKSQATDPTLPLLPGKRITPEINPKPQFGLTVGAGSTQLHPKLDISRNDTLKNIAFKSNNRLEFGFVGQFELSRRLALRFSVQGSLDGGRLTYTKQTSTGQTVIEALSVKSSSVQAVLPFILKFPSKYITPFISLGPTFNILVSQNTETKSKIPLKSFDMMGDGGIGLDILLGKSKLIFSPQLRYSLGITNSNQNTGNYYSGSISNLRKQFLTFSLSIRK